MSAISGSSPASGVRASRTGWWEATSRIRRWSSFVLGLAIVGGCLWWVVNSRLFDLRTLSIEGNTRLSQQEIAALAGLSTGTNVLWTAPGTLERRIERSPWVLEATVSRTLPSTLRISVRERTPVAVTAGGTLLLSGDGKVLGPATARQVASLPTIEISGDRLEPGEAVPGPVPALRVAGSLPEGLRSSVARVITAGDEIRMELRTGENVLYGEATAVEAKGAALEAVLGWIRRMGLSVGSVDLRVPRAPAVRAHASGR